MDFGDNIWEVDWDEPGAYQAEAGGPASAASAASGCGGSSAPRSVRPSGSWSRARRRAPYHFHHGGESS